MDTEGIPCILSVGETRAKYQAFKSSHFTLLYKFNTLLYYYRMSQIDLSNYKSLYLEVAREYLGKLDANLALLKNDLNNSETIAETHLNIHSLGTQSYAMGYNSICALCRVIESYFYSLKENNKPFTLKYLADIETSIQNIRSSISNIETHNEEQDLSSITMHLKEKLLGGA